MRIAILYICTGKYNIFWRGFYESFDENFIKNVEKEYFVFTDAKHIYDEDCNKVHKVFQKDLGWPSNTLKRFSIFLKVEEELRKFEYIFFFNANARCCTKITEQEILPLGEKKLIVVQHPGYYNKNNNEFPYERNKMSAAYIPMGEGNYYVCGGINGGERDAYLNLINELALNIIKDEKKHIMARWHDESHLNKYILGRDDVNILSPGYCFPEGYNIPFEKKIMVLDKSKYLDIDKIKKTDKMIPFNIRIKIVMKKIFRVLGIKIGS